MAKLALPYPNLDFTPLDILTAAELDQMHANTKYLSEFCKGLTDDNGLILPSKLSQFVFSKKLPRVNDLQTTPWISIDIPGWTLDVDLVKDQKVQIDLWTSYLHAANDSSAELDFLLFADNSEIGKSFCTAPVTSIERKVTTIYQISNAKRVTFKAVVVSGSNRRLSIYDGGISVHLIR